MIQRFIRKLISIEVPLWVIFVIAIVLASLLGSYLSTSSLPFHLPFSLGETNGTAPTFTYGPRPELSDPNFFNTVRKKFIEAKSDFIEVDLSQMLLRVYKAGVPAKEFKILSKGRDGSWWETPAGLYKIETKERNHFSSFGSVYQPWSMAFQGNFFIHGWPYYEDGTPVNSQYSGGCVRLATSDAEEVYNLTSIGMPVLVYEKSFQPDEFLYEETKPDIKAASYLAADLNNNFILFEKDKNAILPIASVTKLMTGLIVAEYINLEKEIFVEPRDLVETSRPRLISGAKYSAYDLLFPLLLESSNEAASVLARQLGRNRFVELMNKKAQALGMLKTTFTDASGADAGNQSTAEDLFVLAKYLYNNRSFLLEITSGKLPRSAYGKPSFSDLWNLNLGSEDERFVGGKVGKSEAAGETFLGIFSITISDKNRPIAILLLRGDDRLSDDLQAARNWISARYKSL